jgi:hypothetical protein
MKTDEEHAGARLDFKHEAALMLKGKKTKEEQIEFLEKMLKDLAMERIGGVLDDHERKLGKDLEKLRVDSFGLGAESIAAVAGLEQSREDILVEKRFFEKFMNTLIPGSIPKRKMMETEELLAAIKESPAEGGHKDDTQAKKE